MQIKPSVKMYSCHASLRTYGRNKWVKTEHLDLWGQGSCVGHMKGIEWPGSTLRSCGYAKAPSFLLAIAAEMRAAGISPLSPYNLSRMNLPGPGELSTPIFFCCFPTFPSTFWAKDKMTSRSCSTLWKSTTPLWGDCWIPQTCLSFRTTAH